MEYIPSGEINNKGSGLDSISNKAATFEAQEKTDAFITVSGDPPLFRSVCLLIALGKIPQRVTFNILLPIVEITTAS